MTILIEQEMEAERKDSQSFLDAIADIEIDAPANYSATFEEQLYANKPSLANSPPSGAKHTARNCWPKWNGKPDC
jgi:hypothetical protein